MKTFFEANSVLSLIKMLGLHTDHKTGGQQFDNYKISKITTKNGQLVMHSEDSEPMMIMNFSEFMKSIYETEKQLDMKLFS